MEETGIFHDLPGSHDDRIEYVVAGSHRMKEQFVFLCSWIFHHYPAIVYSAQKITCLGIFFSA